VRRGDIWRIQGPLRREHVVLVVGSDALARFYPMVQVVPIFDLGTARDTLVTVTLPEEPYPGVALTPGVHPVRRGSAPLEHLGRVRSDVMDRIDIALRAVFDL
jgi:mRNA-degrading endonuclease toxin of MazEF toxin-antitoxin module